MNIPFFMMLKYTNALGRIEMDRALNKYEDFAISKAAILDGNEMDMVAQRNYLEATKHLKDRLQLPLVCAKCMVDAAHFLDAVENTDTVFEEFDLSISCNNIPHSLGCIGYKGYKE